MRRPLVWVCLFFVFLIWIVTYIWSDYIWPDKPISEQTVRIEGTVCDKQWKIYHSEKVLILYLNHISIQNQNQIDSYSNYEKIMCYLYKMEDEMEPGMGEIVLLEGKMEGFDHATNPGQFDAKNYYTILDIVGRVGNAKLIKRTYTKNRFLEFLYQMKKQQAEIIDYFYEKNEASVMKALLLGEKSGLEEEIKDMYKRNGLLHAIVVSGLHISCLGMGVYSILKKMYVPIPISAVLSMILVVIYGIMIGQQVSAWRAIIMFLLKLLADLVGRTYDALTAISVAAVLVLFSQPLYLQHAGFMLSFGCVLGVLCVHPLINAFIKEIAITVLKKKNHTGCIEVAGKRDCRIVLHEIMNQFMGRLQDGMSMGISIMLTTLPIQLYFYYEYSIISLLWNLFVIPIVGLLLPLGIIQLIVTWLPAGGIMKSWGIGNLDMLLADVNTIILKGIENICLLGDKLPLQKIIAGCPELWQIGLYYFLLGILLKTISCKWEKRKILLVTPIIIGVMLTIILIRPFEGIRYIQVDIGQGDATIIQTNAKSASIFDCGSSSIKECGKNILIPLLKYYGITNIDQIFLSHPDSDHMNGLIELLQKSELERIHIGAIILPKINCENVEGEFKEIVDLATGQQIPIFYAKAGDTIYQETFPSKNSRLSKLKIVCLHPETRENIPDSNAASAVYWVSYGKCNMLITGDVESGGEKVVLDYLNKFELCEPEILKVAHHGSSTSSTKEFLDYVRPNMALISCGKGNTYGHPHEEALERLEAVGCKVLRTDQIGAIRIIVDKDGNIGGVESMN